MHLQYIIANVCVGSDVFASFQNDAHSTPDMTKGKVKQIPGTGFDLHGMLDVDWTNGKVCDVSVCIFGGLYALFCLCMRDTQTSLLCVLSVPHTFGFRLTQ